LASQNAQNLQDELDDVKTKSLIKEAATLDKLKRAFSDVKNQQAANKNLAKTIQDIEIEQEAGDKAHDELARRP
jgi:hypothetical protein